MTNQFALSLEVVMHANQACYIAIGLAQIRPDQSGGLSEHMYLEDVEAISEDLLLTCN